MRPKLGLEWLLVQAFSEGAIPMKRNLEVASMSDEAQTRGAVLLPSPWGVCTALDIPSNSHGQSVCGNGNTTDHELWRHHIESAAASPLYQSFLRMIEFAGEAFRGYHQR
jgi:hypothetical protein